ncbi:hypothetical protein [Stutzerimonas stutzeri]|jgi:hypothetical protein|uniref:hypothetical protein n=1 Tax=Stutzerimonas stutzeri TaxID=316 RepID=UPI001CFE3955|nr:hypothetical protein [Stutzerimonas stutzeri]
MDTTVEARLHAARPVFGEIQSVLQACLQRSAIRLQLPDEGEPTRSEVRIDPFDRSECFYSEWRSARGDFLGSMQINGDGQVYAEFDVLLAHPHQPAWMVEAVAVWGWPGALKSELRLLPVLEHE